MKFKNRKTILALAIPSMVENLLQMLMGVVDSYLVAQLGLIAVSGVSLANNIITIYQALFIALGSAISSLIARSISAGDHKKYHKYLGDAIVITMGLSFIFGLLSIILGRNFLIMLGANVELASVGGSYLKIVGGMIVSLGLLTSLGAAVRSQGDARLPMVVSVIANLINLVLSTLSIYVFDFGLVGVAWSTVLARCIGIVILLRKLPIKAILENISLKPDREMLGMSLPAAAERLMMRVGDVLIIMIIVHLGTEVLAGNAIGETISQINYMPGLAIATATIILVAKELGQKNYQAIRQLLRETFILSTIIMVVISTIIFFIGPFMTTLYTNNKVALDASMVVLLFSLLGAPATAGTLIYTALWQGLGNARLPFYATTIGMWLIRIGFGYIFGIVMNFGLAGVWMATVLDNMTRWLILAYMYRQFHKKMTLN